MGLSEVELSEVKQSRTNVKESLSYDEEKAGALKNIFREDDQRKNRDITETRQRQRYKDTKIKR